MEGNNRHMNKLYNELHFNIIM